MGTIVDVMNENDRPEPPMAITRNNNAQRIDRFFLFATIAGKSTVLVFTDYIKSGQHNLPCNPSSYNGYTIIR